MKFIATLFCCLMFVAGFAETIGNLEYQLPEGAKDWEMANKLHNEKGTTLIYIPKGASRETSKESFGINTNYFSSNLDDGSEIKMALKAIYPEMNIELQILEKGDNGLVYEWAAKESGQEKVHGWGRVFSTQDGSTVLSYQTENIPDLNKARNIWLPALKKAHQR